MILDRRRAGVPGFCESETFVSQEWLQERVSCQFEYQNLYKSVLNSPVVPLPRSVIIPAFMLVSAILACNHVAARIAFEHGANVTTAVAVRSGGAAFFTMLMLLATGVRIGLPQALRGKALVVGLCFALQSYCLYSAIAAIPVALALLMFNIFPLILVLLAWATGTERPGLRAFLVMPVALLGLAMALDVAGLTTGRGFDFAGRWTQIGVGVLWAIGAAFSMAAGMFLTNRWLGGMDGRLRTLTTMSVVAVVMIAKGAGTGSFALPVDAIGWGALAALTLLYTAGFTLMFVLLPRSGAASNTAALNFEPIAALILAWLLLGQSIAPLQVVGALVVIGAIIALSLPKRAG